MTATAVNTHYRGLVKHAMQEKSIVSMDKYSNYLFSTRQFRLNNIFEGYLLYVELIISQQPALNKAAITALQKLNYFYLSLYLQG